MGAAEEASSPSLTRTGISYLTVRPIARGGMGRVDLVLRREGRFERLYALKRLHAQYRDDGDFRDMFLEEARVAGLIRHPNVVSVLDVGQDDEGPFLLMDFVDGVSLSDVVRQANASGCPVPLPVCLSLLEQIAAGLHAAHDLVAHDGSPLSLVHRDVSPQNVLVGFDGVARVTDFGVAKALGRQQESTAGLLKGKVAYMSPEQLRFERVDRRSDLFALGVVTHELLTATRLYKEREVAETARRILHEAPPDLAAARPDAPPALVALVRDMLAKDRTARPDTARAIAERARSIARDLAAPSDAAERHMRERFGEERDARREARAAAIDEAQRRGHAAHPPLPAHAATDSHSGLVVAQPRRVPAWQVAVLVATGAVVAAGLTWWMTRPEIAAPVTRPASPPAAPPTTAVGNEPGAEAATAPVPAPPADEPESDDPASAAEPGPGTETDGADARGGAAADRSRRRPRRPPERPATRQPASMSDRLWGWP